MWSCVQWTTEDGHLQVNLCASWYCGVTVLLSDLRLYQKMDQDANVPDAQAGASQHVDGAGAVDRGDEGNPVAQLQSQILELGQKHDQVLSALANMSNACTRSYVYIPRERQIVPFSGDCCTDNQTVDEFIDEIERVIRVRGLNSADQVDFILSHLRGSALDEIKLCMGGEMKQPQELFAYLRGAFREKRTTPQLLHAFYARRQSDGEDFRDYSHSLSQLLTAALQQSANVVADPQLALRDQFIEGVREPTLRRELRRFVRERPHCTLFDVRDEAMMWCVEDKPRGANVARSRNIVGAVEISEQANSGCTVPTELAVTLQEVVKVITQQGKAISELTDAVRELTMQKVSVPDKSTKPKFKPKYTDDGQPICLRCEGVGHLARKCTAPYRSKGQPSSTSASAVPGNGFPPLQ